MRVLVLDSDYLSFLDWLYRANPGLESGSYEEQLARRRDALFGTASSYAAAFRELGHEALEIFVNNWPMQSAWARENGVRVARGSRWRRADPRSVARRTIGPWRRIPEHVVRGLSEPEEASQILVAEVEAFAPDLILDQNLGAVLPEAVRAIRGRTGVFVGQHAATTLPPNVDLAIYDLLISSFQPTVVELQRRGLHAELSLLGFDPEVLTAFDSVGVQRYGLTFVGSLAPIHSSRRTFLETLAQLVPDFRIWSPDPVPNTSILRARHMGVEWGRGMFDVLRSSRATVNHHGDIAPYANNMRLYEATGIGTVLITDSKPNLSQLFEPARELLTYDSAEECAALYDSLDDESRESIAVGGQRRTLADHTYLRRVKEILDYVERLERGRHRRSRP
jgi:spore maturation protein CgeB